MPDNSGHLTEADIKFVQEWCSSKWIDRSDHRCEMCGQNTWEVSQNLALAPVFPGTDNARRGKVFIFAVVTCTNCMNQKFLNVLSIKLMKTQDLVENKDV